MGHSPPAAPSALHCLTHLGDFSTRVGSDGRTKPWVGRTLAGPLGAGGVLWFHPRGHVSRVSEEPLRGRDKNGLWSGRGVQVTCSVEAGGLGGAGGGDRAELVPLGGPSWSSSALGKTGGAFTQLSWWLPAPRGRLKEGPTLLRAALGSRRRPAHQPRGESPPEHPRGPGTPRAHLRAPSSSRNLLG